MESKGEPPSSTPLPPRPTEICHKEINAISNREKEKNEEEEAAAGSRKHKVRRRTASAELYQRQMLEMRIESRIPEGTRYSYAVVLGKSKAWKKKKKGVLCAHETAVCRLLSAGLRVTILRNTVEVRITIIQWS